VPNLGRQTPTSDTAQPTEEGTFGNYLWVRPASREQRAGGAAPGAAEARIAVTEACHPHMALVESTSGSEDLGTTEATPDWYRKERVRLTRHLAELKAKRTTMRIGRLPLDAIDAYIAHDRKALDDVGRYLARYPDA
jgi:hypothetical protein